MALLLFCVATVLSIPTLRSEKLRLLILRNQIETSAAPDEPVLTDDWLLYRALLWKGSHALQHQLVYIADGQLPTANQELVLAVSDGDPLLAKLKAHGLTLTANISQRAWADSGKGFHWPSRQVIHIYFATPPPPK